MFNLFCLGWIEPSLCCEPPGWDTFVCNSLHASFAVCGSSVKQVSHSWHIVLDTDTLYTFLNFITQFISLLNLHLEPQLIIVNIAFENLHSVYRSLEIHNCALTSSPPPHLGPPKISLFFFPLPPQFSFFLLSLGGLLVEFWWCF